MKPKQTMNKSTIRRLERVIEVILEEPRRIDMGKFVRDPDSVSEAHRPDCGTIGCIAGWVVANELTKPSGVYRLRASICSRAVDLLPGISVAALFYVDCWPTTFSEKLARCKPGTRPYAKTVAARIRFFLDTNGTDREDTPNAD